MNYKRKGLHTVWIGLGSNKGDRAQFLKSAIELIAQRIGEIEDKSSIYYTEAWGVDDGPEYYNQVIVAATNLSAQNLMVELLQIEKELGRERKGERYAPREIDLDILFYNDKVIHSDNLQIPHPRIQERKFVLVPLNEVSPQKIHPQFKISVSKMLEDCSDVLTVRKK